MGGSTSKDSKYLSIRIDLDNSTYNAGEEMMGTIHIFVNYVIRLNTLSLKFCGKETIQTDASQKLCKLNKKKSKKDSFLIRKLEYTVCEWTRSIKPGIHSIPFKFTIPSELPGTFKYKKEELCMVNYKIVAFTTLKNQKISNAQPVIIRQEPQENPKIPIRDHFSDISRFCDKSRNICKVRIQEAKEEFKPTAKESFYINIDNSQSSVGVNNLELVFYMMITFKNEKNEKIVKNLKLFKVTKKINVLPKQKKVGHNAITVEVDFSAHQDKLRKYPSIKSPNIESCYIVTCRVCSCYLFLCPSKSAETSTFINISPVYDLERIVPWKPYYAKPIEYETIDLKENRGQIFETDHNEAESEKD